MPHRVPSVPRQSHQEEARLLPLSACRGGRALGCLSLGSRACRERVHLWAGCPGGGWPAGFPEARGGRARAVGGGQSFLVQRGPKRCWDGSRVAQCVSAGRGAGLVPRPSHCSTPRPLLLVPLSWTVSFLASCSVWARGCLTGGGQVSGCREAPVGFELRREAVPVPWQGWGW